VQVTDVIRFLLYLTQYSTGRVWTSQGSVVQYTCIEGFIPSQSSGISSAVCDGLKWTPSEIAGCQRMQRNRTHLTILLWSRYLLSKWRCYYCYDNSFIPNYYKMFRFVIIIFINNNYDSVFVRDQLNYGLPKLNNLYSLLSLLHYCVVGFKKCYTIWINKENFNN